MLKGQDRCLKSQFSRKYLFSMSSEDINESTNEYKEIYVNIDKVDIFKNRVICLFMYRTLMMFLIPPSLTLHTYNGQTDVIGVFFVFHIAILILNLFLSISLQRNF